MKAPCVGMQGKMLPSVTAEDNGDVLTVVDGEWQKASGGEGGDSGGGGAFYINIIIDEEENNALDKTWKQIYDAVVTNKQGVFFIENTDTACYIYTLSGISWESGTYMIETSSGTSYYADTENDYPINQ